MEWKKLVDILNQLDITLSELRDALRGTGNKDFTTLETDVESVLAQLDITLSALRDALRGTGNKTLTDLDTDLNNILGQLDVLLSTRASESTLSSVLSQLDITISSLRDALLEPTLDTLVLNNATVNSSGDSGNLTIKGAKHVDVLIRVGGITGSPSIQFHLQVIEPTSGAVIRTYDGTSITTANTSDYINVDGLTLGTTVKVTWDGTLDDSNYFSGVFCRVVAKR